MKKPVFVLFIIMTTIECLASDCQITTYSKNSFETRVHSLPEMRDFSKTVNNLIKKSYDSLTKLDDTTLGLVSAIATGGLPLDQLKPEQWDKLNLTGHLIYQDMPFSGTPLRGAKIIISGKSNSQTVTTGVHGEFSESFSKLVPFTKFRLFPFPSIYMGNNSVPTIKVPITLKVESKVCHAELKMSEIPLEPLIIILSKIESK